MFLNAICESVMFLAGDLCREREKYHKQLEDQAAEYKVIIQHHLSVNEKMLRDKEQLSEKCCNLAGILSVAESKVSVVILHWSVPHGKNLPVELF